MIIYVKCPKEVWGHSGCSENVKSPTSTSLNLDYVMVHDQFNHQKKRLLKNFLELSDTFSIEVNSLLNKDYDQCKVDFHILKM